jgi:hypothetical protein
MQFAEKIRKLVESTAFRFDDVVIPVTISVGAATMSAVPTLVAGRVRQDR